MSLLFLKHNAGPPRRNIQIWTPIDRGETRCDSNRIYLEAREGKVVSAGVPMNLVCFRMWVCTLASR